MFGNLEFGPVEGINMSHLGIALKNSSGNMVSYDRENGEIIDVDLIDFNAENMVYSISCAIKDIKEGDTIRHVNGNVVFVTSTEGSIHIVDVAEGEKKEILPTKSMFGFDFVTKIVPLIDFSVVNASEDHPFGNMLPLLLLNNHKSSKKDMLLAMALMNNENMCFGDFNNPLLLMALMSNDDEGGSESKDFFPMIIAMQSMRKKEEKDLISTENK